MSINVNRYNCEPKTVCFLSLFSAAVLSTLGCSQRPESAALLEQAEPQYPPRYAGEEDPSEEACQQVRDTHIAHCGHLAAEKDYFCREVEAVKIYRSCLEGRLSENPGLSCIRH